MFYDILMICAIMVSLIPLALRDVSSVLLYTDLLAFILFLLDYILRIITADYKLKIGALSFIKYPFTLGAIIDLVSLIPLFAFIAYESGAHGVMNYLRVIGILKVFRAFKLFRYSKSVRTLLTAIKNSKNAFLAVFILTVGYILISALVVFNVERETFATFFDAIYWATVSLTTVGYGDIYPVTLPGRVVTIISCIFGIIVMALPAGIITAGYMEEMFKGGKESTEYGEDHMDNQ